MTWLQTRNGRSFDLLAPNPEAVDFDEIAEATAKLCRFTGHTRLFYSVAEHCCRVSDHILSTTGDPLAAAHGLVHDAHEAYLGDWSTPLKAALRALTATPLAAANGFAHLEGSIEQAVHAAAGLAFPLDPWTSRLVREADRVLLMTERRDLMVKPPVSWGADLEAIAPLPAVIKPWPWPKAADAFRARAVRLLPRITLRGLPAAS